MRRGVCERCSTARYQVTTGEDQAVKSNPRGYKRAGCDCRGNYADFIATKRRLAASSGLDHETPPDYLFDFQKRICSWAATKGRAAIFANCGLGKTVMQLWWANQVPGRTLILAPLAVAEQTEREAERFGLACSRDPSARVVVTNYQRLHQFDADDFNAVVLDESSILKSFDGKTRTRIIEAFADHPYKLACTATPSPNDYMELGNHAEFLNVCSRAEMLAMSIT